MAVSWLLADNPMDYPLADKTANSLPPGSCSFFSFSRGGGVQTATEVQKKNSAPIELQVFQITFIAVSNTSELRTYMMIILLY